MDRFQWDRQLYRWQDYVPPPGGWALDLLITVLFVLLVLFAHVGATSPASHAQTAALVIAECVKRAPPHSDLRMSLERCRIKDESGALQNMSPSQRGRPYSLMVSSELPFADRNSGTSDTAGTAASSRAQKHEAKFATEGSLRRPRPTLQAC